MQYHIQTLVKHLFDKDSFEQVTVQELKQFTDDYPYAAVGQYLYAKKLKESGSYNHYEQSEQASLYFHNALWLRWQLEHKEAAPELQVKVEEPAQQPGFRIVVQMPKTAPAIISPKPAVQQEEKKEEEPAIHEVSATNEAIEATAPEQIIQPAAEQTTTPEQEETIATEQENGLKVNENGSLVEHKPDAGEQTPETPAMPVVNTTIETASAVAIAENSQLAEESAATEAAVNAVSITEEVLIPAEAKQEVAPEAAVENIEVDDIIPAVEITPEEVATSVSVIDEAPPVEVTAGVAETALAEAITIPEGTAAPVENSASAYTEETIPVVEQQPVETITESIAAEEPAAVTTETVQAVVTENTTGTPSVVEEPEQNRAEPAQPKPFDVTPANQEEKAAVDLGEPIFESYHTIDYFASQGIKLMQEELKDKLGKQLKSFTDWLRSMKRIGPMETNTSLDEVTNKSIQRIAEHSVEEKEVLTEAMAEVWAKQGNAGKAIRVYEKLSLLNPAKSTYFAGRIEQLKAQ